MSKLNQNKDARKKKALGRGLGSLIPSKPVAAAGGVAALSSDDAGASPDYFLCKLSSIKPCSTQPRKHFDPDALQELSDSIKESGLIQPLVVRKIEGESKYELIAGERRWRASKLAGLKEVPVVLKDVSDAVAFALALIENIQRQDLNPVEEALAYRRLIEEFEFTQAELAGQVGKSRAAVSNSMRLLQLPGDVLELLADGSLSAGHARALLSIDEEDASVLAEMIVDQQLTVRDVEQKARSIKNGVAQVTDGALEYLEPEDGNADENAEDTSGEDAIAEPELKEVSFQAQEEGDAPQVSSPTTTPAANLRDDDTTHAIVAQLSTALSASRVQLHDQHGKGSIEIHYDDYAALKRLLDALDIKVDL